MPVVHVDIKAEIIIWALSQTDNEKLGSKLIDNIAQWLDGTKTPTFSQIEDFSKKSNIPLGYFFLQTPPEEQIALLEYRTIDSVQLANPSRNLIDTIHEMESVQDWMKNYRVDLGYDKLQVVGSMKDVNEAKLIADRIRSDLDLDEAWYEESSDIRNSFKRIRSKLEENGVLVMMNGIVGKNTHRPLDIDEFRAFAIMDEWAPLIFINAADSQAARLFSLLHEVAHIWIGMDDFFNDRYSHTENVSFIEVLCNAVAGEILVPNNIFKRKWNEFVGKEKDSLKIELISKYFCCGESVIARKALDNKKISDSMYRQVIQTAIDHYRDVKENNVSTGGNYYNTMGSRLDGCFVRALCESISMGRTSYTEAYRLTDTSSKTFSAVVQGLGGVEW